MSKNYHPDDAPQWAARPIRSTVGDVEFDRLMGQRSYQDARVGRLGGSMPRPEPLGIPGRASSIAGTDGGGTGIRQGSVWHGPRRGQ